jgi:hypothetical protein
MLSTPTESELQNWRENCGFKTVPKLKIGKQEKSTMFILIPHGPRENESRELGIAHFEKLLQAGNHVLDDLLVLQLWQEQISRLCAERLLGVRKPRPVIRVRSPRVRMFEGKRQTVVYRCHFDARPES